MVVGLNTTKSGKATLIPYEERKIILESIKYVDEVIPIRTQQDKYNYLKNVDLFIIGSDYIGYDDMPYIESQVKTIYLPRTPNISSTQIKQNISDNTIYNTFVVDIDDTICYTQNRDFENSIPNEEVINKINELYDNGWNIVLFTARGAKSCKTLEERIAKYDDITKRWLAKNNVKYHELVFGKMNADYYVDDKNMSINEFINYDVPKLRRIKK